MFRYRAENMAEGRNIHRESPVMELFEICLDVLVGIVILMPLMLICRAADAVADAGEAVRDVWRRGWPAVRDWWAWLAWRVDSWVTRW